MALNQYMHPRNKYKYKKPDFKALAIKYPEFRAQATQDLRGNVHLDFKNPDAVRALTCVLLKDDFDLDIELPSDRLIPTVPQRLNYILWMEDIMSAINRQDNIYGIDIGMILIMKYKIFPVSFFIFTVHFIGRLHLKDC